MSSTASIHDGDRYVAQFGTQLFAPRAVRARKAPFLLPGADGDKRRNTPPTPPTPPPATRMRVASPSRPWSHAGLREAARGLSVAAAPAADRGATPLRIQAPRVPRPDGLYVEDQPLTSQIHTSQDRAVVNTCASHVLNQAFQGNAVGIAFQSIHIGQMQQALHQARAIDMDDLAIILQPG